MTKAERKDAIAKLNTVAHYGLDLEQSDLVDDVIGILERDQAADLGEDAINRKAVLNTLDYVDKALTDEDRTIEEFKDLFVECIKALTPTTSTREHGEWICLKRGKNIDVCCSKFSTVLCSTIGYSIEDIKKEMAGDTWWKRKFC
ncbi:MAG: hypothetical protein J6U37_03300, partial [Lachnospiraceae bacterium]|nr:hypothetical protein [Lachnospiraceae bacterium]